MTTLRSSITTPYWSISNDALGEVVVDVQEINQNIRNIILTAPGTDYGRPEFGCGLYEYIDRPTLSVASKIKRTIIASIERWEERVNIIDLTYTIPEAHKLVYTLLWSPPDGMVGVADFKIRTDIVIQPGNVYIVDQFNRLFETDLGYLIM